MEDVQILDNPYYSLGFPLTVQSLIPRDNYISQIEDCIAKGIRVIFLEGEEDSGKTTLCSLIAKRNPYTSISVFMNPLSNLDFNTSFLYSTVGAQIRNILKEYKEDYELSWNQEQYQNYMLKVRKKRLKEQILFIIDGLEYKIKEDPQFVKKILEDLPFGVEQFTILICGDKNEYHKIYPKIKSEDAKSIFVTGFSEPEIIQYLDVEPTSSSEMRELFKITKGYPGRLKTLKRIISTDAYSLDEIQKNTTYNNWIEIDCEKVDLNNKTHNLLFSVLSLTEELFTCEEISNIINREIEEIQTLINSFPILQYSSQKVIFVSSEHKRYFISQLRNNRSLVRNLLIDFHKNSHTISSLAKLPKLYATNKEWTKIIDLVDDDYFSKIIDGTGSLQPVNESIALGVTASKENNSYTQLWRFSLTGCMINELDNFLFWDSEIEARISIHDFIGAISLANSAILKVERFKLLTLIARRQKELSNKVDSDLIAMIQELYEKSDFSSFGDKLYDIVADLIYAIPSIAIDIIQKTSSNTSEKNINDWILTKLSIAAIDSSKNDTSEIDSSKKIEAIHSLNGPLADKVNKAVSFLVGNYTSLKVLDEVNKLTDSEEKLRLLRLWLNNNRKNIKDVEKVIDKALNELLLASSEASLTLDTLKDLSYQLPYVTDREIRLNLYKRFKTIENTISDLGLSKNKYIYQLNIFHAEFTFDEVKSFQTLKKIIDEIDQIDDLLVKIESFAEVYAKLCILKHSVLEAKIKFVYGSILRLIDNLFNSTSDHFMVSKYFLSTLSKRNSKLGLIICEKINTLNRREKARLLVTDSYLENGLKKIKINTLKKIEAAFENNISRQKFLLKVLERFSDARKLNFDEIKQLMYFIDQVKDIDSATHKTIAYVFSYKILCKNWEFKKRISSEYQSLIINSWQRIEADWERVDLGFTICSLLSKENEHFAKRMFDESLNIKKESWIDSNLVAETYINSLSLIARGFANLAGSKSDTKNDFTIVDELISALPSEIVKIKLWTELGFHCQANQRDDLNKSITEEKIIPLLDGAIANKRDVTSVLDSFTLVYLLNTTVALSYISKISSEHKEEIFGNISYFYITKRNPFEIYERYQSKYNVTYVDLLNAVNAIKYLNTDSEIYHQIEYLCKAAEQCKGVLSNTQLTEIITILEGIITDRLPDQRNIKHDGYKILCKMQLAKISKNIPKKFWDDLILEVDNISNVSDATFVRAVLLDEIPFDKISKGQEEKTNLYNSVLLGLSLLTSHYEYIQRVIDISDTMYKRDMSTWKKMVSKAFEMSSALESGSEAYLSKKKLVDTMYRMDPNFAKDLIKITDKENKDNKFANYLNKQLESLEIADKIKKGKDLQASELESNRNLVVAIIEALKSLNSQRLSSRKLNELSIYLQNCNTMPMHEVYPILVYYLLNCRKTYPTSLKLGDSELHKGNFTILINATKIIRVLSQKRKTSSNNERAYFIDEEFITNKALRPGSREEALSFIKNWLEDEMEDFIIIADPYFEKKDLEILKSIKEVLGDLEIDIDILGSTGGLINEVETNFKEYWKEISAEDPPFTTITFCWIPSDNNHPPFHDRWIISKKSGLRLGTSLNSIGLKRDSELSIMQSNEALNIKENTLLDYINKKKKSVNNLRINYRSFTL